MRERAANRPGPAGCRSGRASRVPARRHVAEGRSLPAADVRRALRHDGRGTGHEADRAQRHRDCTARIHARAIAQRIVRHPGRGAEYERRTDENVPDANRLRFPCRRNR